MMEKPDSVQSMGSYPPETGPLGGDHLAERRSWVKRHPRWLLLLLLLLVTLGVGLGAGLGVGLSHHKVGIANASNSPHTPSPSSSASTSSSTPLDSSGNDPTKITPLAKWDWSKPTSKALGVSLGNWLVLERWMDEDWWTEHAPAAGDEWSFHQTLGDKTVPVLDAHMSTFITEADVQIMYEAGINTVRIPTAYWFWIPVEGNEPYRNGTHLEHLTQMMGWLWKRGMRTVIDLHQMPGSQSGDQASGHATANPQWYSSTNQQRSDQLIKALIQWLQPHPYRSVVSGVCPVNEPNGPLGATPSHLDTTASFYNRTYPVLSAAELTMFFHHGFAGNPVQYWRGFASGKDPRLLVLNDNPYPGFYPAKNVSDTIFSAVCSSANQYASFPVPTVRTEYSLISGIYNNDTWNQVYYNTQTAAYGWTGGSFFWSYLVKNSTHPLYAGTPSGQVLWSFLTQLQKGNILPVSKGQNAQQYLTSLPKQACG